MIDEQYARVAVVNGLQYKEKIKFTGFCDWFDKIDMIDNPDYYDCILDMSTPNQMCLSGFIESKIDYKEKDEEVLLDQLTKFIFADSLIGLDLADTKIYLRPYTRFYTRVFEEGDGSYTKEARDILVCHIKEWLKELVEKEKIGKGGIVFGDDQWNIHREGMLSLYDINVIASYLAEESKCDDWIMQLIYSEKNSSESVGTRISLWIREDVVDYSLHGDDMFN